MAVTIGVTRIQRNEGSSPVITGADDEGNTARSSGFPPNPVAPAFGGTTGLGENGGAVVLFRWSYSYCSCYVAKHYQ